MDTWSASRGCCTEAESGQAAYGAASPNPYVKKLRELENLLADSQGAIRLSGIVHESVVDGPGIRMTVFTQGCVHGCNGCHNKSTQPLSGGYLKPIDDIIREYMDNPLYDGITLSGGEPFCQPSRIREIGRRVRDLGGDVIAYTGFLFEDLVQSTEALDALGSVDYLIDGPFVESMKSLELRYRGSSNQRIIDVRKSLASGYAVEAEL